MHNYALSIVAAGVVIAVLYLGRAVFITALVALIIAFLLEPFVGLLTRARTPRPLATFLVCAFAVLAIYFIGQSLWRQLSGIAREAPELRTNLMAAVEKSSEEIQSLGDSATRLLGTGPKPVAAPPPDTNPAAKRGKKDNRAGYRPGPARRNSGSTYSRGS